MGERLAPHARLALVTPHRQFPTGAALSGARRERLLAWARRSGAWITDNGYDCEIDLGAERSVSLAASGEPSVIYLNSFNKILFPALRIGYLVVPKSLVETFARARRTMVSHSNVPNQMVLRDFLEGGHFDEHVRICRDAYREREEELLATIEERLSPWLRLRCGPRGLHVTAEVTAGLSATDLIAEAHAAGIDITPMSQFYNHGGGEKEILLGFAGFSASTLRSAALRLSRICQHLSEHRRSPPS